jgi:hypothetical protein
MHKLMIGMILGVTLVGCGSRYGAQLRHEFLKTHRCPEEFVEISWYNY